MHLFEVYGTLHAATPPFKKTFHNDFTVYPEPNIFYCEIEREQCNYRFLIMSL